MDRFPPFHEGKLLKTKITVNPGKGGLSGSLVRIEQKLGAVDSPVIIEFDGFLIVPQGLHRPVGGLLGNGIVKPGGGVLGI